MKLTKRSVLVFSIIFILLNFFTISIGSPGDGNNLVGFPLCFYEYLGGKRFPEPASRHVFHLFNFLIDFFVVGIAAFLLEKLVRKIKT